MWTWVLVGVTALCGGLAWVLRKRVSPSAENDLDHFVQEITRAIRECGDSFDVRGVVPGTFTMVISVYGQEVPVPLDNIHRHYCMVPEQLSMLARQLLMEIEEVGLERPEDHSFVDAAMRILPQICSLDWVFENGPAFGDSALVYREIGSGLATCFVIDDPWSIVFVCRAHLKVWGRTEQDVFSLANQNLRKLSGVEVPMPSEVGGMVRLSSGDGYDAARVLLLDPDKAEDLLIAMPERNTLYLGREEDRDQMAKLMARDEGKSTYPVADGLYRLKNQQLVPATEPDLV